MERSSIDQGPHQAEGVRQPLREAEHLMAPRQRLGRIAQPPQRESRIGQDEYPGILSREGQGMVRLEAREGQSLFQVSTSRSQLTHPIQADPQIGMCPY